VATVNNFTVRRVLGRYRKAANRRQFLTAMYLFYLTYDNVYQARN
jgi:hypothetical protein